MSHLMNKLRQFFTVFLAGVLFLVAAVSQVSPAMAKPLTPEAAAYEIDRADSPQQLGDRLNSQAREHKSEIANPQYAKQAAKNATDEATSNVGGAFENIREKLNLDEPIPESTKEFFSDPVGSFQEEGQYPQENVDNNPHRGMD
jgi:hypothetical protein